MRNNTSQFFSFAALCIGALLMIVAVVLWAQPNEHFDIRIATLLLVGAASTVVGKMNFRSRLKAITGLKLNGHRVTAAIETITLDAHPIRTKRHALYQAFADLNVYKYRIHCTGLNPMTHSNEHFISDPLYFEPELDLTRDRDITVYVNASGDYYVDISSIRVSEPPIREEGTYLSRDGKDYRLASPVGASL